MYHSSLKKNGPVMLKLPFYRTDTINKCVWLRMARMEMANLVPGTGVTLGTRLVNGSNLKTSGIQVCVFVSQIKLVKNDLAICFLPKFI